MIKKRVLNNTNEDEDVIVLLKFSPKRIDEVD
jgi:hypothetical protein